jgi:tetratricopeptide (TPR) repeat protein
LRDYDVAKQLLEEALVIQQELRDQRGIGYVLRVLGYIALRQGLLEEGEDLIHQGITIYQKMGDRLYIARALYGLGRELRLLGKYSEALPPLEQSVLIFDDLGVSGFLSMSHLGLGIAKMHLGTYELARAQGQMGLTLCRKSGYEAGIGDALFLLGCAALAEEVYAEALRLLQESVVIYRKIGQTQDLRGVGLAALGDALAALGYAAFGLGNIPEARQHISEALRTASEIGAFMSPMFALPAIALILADQDEKERAVELYALVSSYPVVANSRWFEDVAGRHIAAVAATLPPEVVTAAQERGKAQDPWTTAEGLADEIEGWV